MGYRACAQRDEAREWRDGELVHEKHRSAELIWFPDPVGARECELVATGVELLVVIAHLKVPSLPSSTVLVTCNTRTPVRAGHYGVAVMHVVRRLLYWLAVFVVSLALVIALILWLESRDRAGVSPASRAKTTILRAAL